MHAPEHNKKDEQRKTVLSESTLNPVILKAFTHVVHGAPCEWGPLHGESEESLLLLNKGEVVLLGFDFGFGVELDIGFGFGFGIRFGFGVGIGFGFAVIPQWIGRKK